MTFFCLSVILSSMPSNLITLDTFWELCDYKLFGDNILYLVNTVAQRKPSSDSFQENERSLQVTCTSWTLDPLAYMLNLMKLL